jgi:peptide subunit release factor 1 (eRF1)
MKDFAERLHRHVTKEKPASVVLLGTAENLAEFRRHLNSETTNRIVLSRNVPKHSDDKDLIARVQEYLIEVESAATRRSVAELYDRLCQDYLAVAGMDETLFSLQIGKLERLFISDQVSEKGHRCTHCDFVFSQEVSKCMYCGGLVEPVELRNRMEKLAEHHEVPIDLVTEPTFLDSLGGVGGFLRF